MDLSDIFGGNSDNDSSDQVQLLVLGDTHVGYRHRSNSKKGKWAQSTDDLGAFRRALNLARELDVDAIVHAGDVFDHQEKQSDRDAVAEQIDRSVEAGIPFYYICGNHDKQDGRHALAQTLGTHLSEASTTIGSSSVDLIGYDHMGSDFPTRKFGSSSDTHSNQTILVIHESPHPVVDNSGKLLYQADSNKADVSHYIEKATFEIDLIITGHLHVADQPRVRGHDIPVLVTGPTIPISKYKKASKPSTWILTATDSGINIDRQPV